MSKSFIKALLKISNEKHDYIDALNEWCLIACDEADDKCICGHEIYYRYHIKNTLNDNTCIVGCDCILKITPNDHFMTKQIKSIKKLQNIDTYITKLEKMYKKNKRDTKDFFINECENVENDMNVIKTNYLPYGKYKNKSFHDLILFRDGRNYIKWFCENVTQCKALRFALIAKKYI